MKNFLYLFVFVALITGCEPGLEGNGNVKEETREAAPFDKMEVQGNFKIFVKQGNYDAITVKADENLLEHIESYVKGGELHVETKQRITHFKKLELYVTMKELNGLDLSGACELVSKDRLKGKNVEMDFSGAVEATLDLVCEELDVDMSGACELNLTGSARKAKFEISGAGEIQSEEFQTQECYVEISGAGEADVWVTEKLDVDVSGAAEVHYKGNPGEVKQDISGAAEVKPM